jgi:hypothetical protein
LQSNQEYSADLDMSRSQYLNQVLYRDQNPASAKVLSELAGSLFLKPETHSSCIETYSLDAAPRHIAECEKYINEDQITHPRSAININPVTQQKKSALKAQGTSQPSLVRSNRIVSLCTSEDLRQYVAVATGFQAFFIRQRHSYSPLTITHELFDSLILQKNVSPQFRDYVLYMGEREREVEIVPPKLRWRTATMSSVQEGRPTFECMYGLRFVELNGRGVTSQPTSRWSFRQTAVYCNFGAVPQDSTWIFVTPSRLAQERLDGYASCKHETSAKPFEIHLLLLDTAMTNWRHYLVELAAETDQHAAQSLGASPDDQGPIGMAGCGESQALMILDNKLQNAAIAISSTMENVKAHLDCHRSIQEGVPKDEESSEFLVIPGFMEQLQELNMLAIRVEALKVRLQGIANLVSGFLELKNGFALQSLAKESRMENQEMRKLSERMHALTEKTTQDAVAIKVLTILTLIYLPTTVVSNFFSTSFVNPQTSPGGSNHVVISGDWWILLAAALPLTLLTLYTWRVCTHIKAYNKYPFWWRFGRGRCLATNAIETHPEEKV